MWGPFIHSDPPQPWPVIFTAVIMSLQCAFWLRTFWSDAFHSQADDTHAIHTHISNIVPSPSGSSEEDRHPTELSISSSILSTGSSVGQPFVHNGSPYYDAFGFIDDQFPLPDMAVSYQPPLSRVSNDFISVRSPYGRGLWAPSVLFPSMSPPELPSNELPNHFSRGAAAE